MKLLTTSVVRGSRQGESHGGVFLVDLETRQVDQKIDWNNADIDWQGRGWDRGLRGIAFHEGLIYIAASDELFAYDQDFNIVGSWRNRYLRHCHEITLQDGTIYMVSTAFDSILGFDLASKTFNWALHVAPVFYGFKATLFDPNMTDGPSVPNKLHLNNVHTSAGALFFSGRRSGGILQFNGKEVTLVAELPRGTHNAQPFRGGVLFNDSNANMLRYIGPTRSQRRDFKIPFYDPESLIPRDFDDSKTARQGFARGLCPIGDHLVAGGSSPSTLCVHDLNTGKTVFQLNLTLDIRNAIHGLEVWPY